MNKRRILILVLLCTSLYIKSQVSFSHDAGIYDTPFYLKAAYSDKSILYYFQSHLDKRKRVFSDSLLIESTTTISFELHHEDSVIELGKKSYFLDFTTNFDIVSLTISHNSLYNPFSGIYVDGPNAFYDSTLSKINGCASMRNSNYTKKIERDVYVEIFDNKGKRIVNQDAGIRIFGGYTRYYPEKSLKIVARKKYGNSRFKANIFNQGTKKYKQFILRHSGQDYRKTRFKDVLSTTLVSQSMVDVQASIPSHLFVNSEYWGVYNIREKLNRYFIDNNYNCGVETIDILRENMKVDCGDSEKYKELLQFISKSDLSEISDYNHAISLMDYRNFANFWIYQIYFGNQDVRGNIRYWRSDSLDGRFRWILYDLDLGWLNPESRLLLDMISNSKITKWYNPKWSTFLLRSLLVNKEFKEYFINQIAFLNSTILSTDYVTKEIEALEHKYKDEMIYHFDHRKKFQNYQGSLKKWHKEVNRLKSFANKRPDVLFSQTQKAFDLLSTYNLEINIENHEQGRVLLNHNELLSKKFSGRFFSEVEVPIDIIPDLGYSCVGWDNQSIINHDDKDVIINISFVKSNESKKKIIINEIDYQNDCFEVFNQDSASIDLNGWKVTDIDNNIYTIDNCILKKGRFAVFHYNNIDNMIDTVIYKKIDFKLSSTNELIAMYDNEARLVNSVGYKLNISNNSYSRNIPFEDFYETKVNWNSTDHATIGFHNQTYTNLLEKTYWRKMKDWLSDSWDALVE